MFASGKTLRHAFPITALDFLYYEVYGLFLLHYSFPASETFLYLDAD
jgi:hypothetical protein